MLEHLSASDWTLQLIDLFCWLEDGFRHRGWFAMCERFSPNLLRPVFTDEELVCVYLYARFQGLHRLTRIHTFARQHMLEFFPALPSYPTFVNRLNRLPELLGHICHELGEGLERDPSLRALLRICDSFPVMLAEGRRAKYARVARGLANYGYCATKNTWFHGVCVHVFRVQRPGSLPLPTHVGVAPASHHDLTVARQVLAELEGGFVVADSAYPCPSLAEQLKQEQNVEYRTSYRRQPGDPKKVIDTESRQLSGHRQPLEALFGWLERKTGLQDAHYVRSEEGLLVHIFGSLLVAMLHWTQRFFNPLSA